MPREGELPTEASWDGAAAPLRRGWQKLVWLLGFGPRTPLALRVAAELQEARHSEREYLEITSLHRERLEKHRRRGDLVGVATESWTLMAIEVNLRHHDAAHALLDAAIDALERADEEVFRLAIAVMTLLASHEAQRGRSDAAIAIYGRALHVCDRADRSEARLGLYLSLAGMHAAARAHAAALAAAEAGLALAGELSVAPRSDPYRAGADRRHFTADCASFRLTILRLATTHITALIHLGRFTDAKDASDAASGRIPGGLSASESRELGLLRGYLVFRAGDYTAAERIYGDIAGEADGDAETAVAMVSLGWTYLRLGCVAEAAGVAAKIMQWDATSIPAGALRSSAELARGQLDAAESFARAVIGRPSEGTSHSAALRVLAEVELARGNLELALDAATAAVEQMRERTGLRDQYTSDSLVTLARVEAAAGRPGAEARFLEALALDMPEDHPRRAAIFSAFAGHLAATGRAAEAESMRARATAICTARGLAEPGV